MIGKLRGKLDEILEDSVILDVGGVGYHVFCSARTIAALPPVGEAAQLIIEMHVREDHIHMYGFPDTVERDWFRLLSTVQRVGNKMALTILGAHSPQALAHAIIAKDTTAFSRISGVGPKLAERIVTELKDKATKLPTSSFQPVSSGTATAIVSGKKGKKTEAAPAASNHVDDAISALVNLGYSRSEAYGAALKSNTASEGKASLDQLIKLCLKELMRAPHNETQE
jgi:Holliday junction DNA helicase RuvA